MADRQVPMTRRRAALALGVGLWLVAFAGAFWMFHAAGPPGAGSAQGANRVTVFLAWQGAAAMLALPVLRVGAGFPRGSGLRRISRLPAICGAAVLLGIAVVAASIWLTRS